jgi:hypothetical protein
VTTPPGVSNHAREVDRPVEQKFALEPLSWRWFLPRSPATGVIFAIGVVATALFVVMLGLAATVWVGLFSIFNVLVMGVGLRRAHPVGRIWRTDPKDAALVGDAMSHLSAVFGTALAVGTILGALAAVVAFPA